MGRARAGLAEPWGNSYTAYVACEYDVAGSCFAEYLRDRDAALEVKARDSKHDLVSDK